MEIFGVYGLSTVLTIIFAVFYYRVAENENASRLLWVGLSVAVSFLTRILGLGLIGLVLGQAALFAGITIVRALISRNR